MCCTCQNLSTNNKNELTLVLLDRAKVALLEKRAGERLSLNPGPLVTMELTLMPRVGLAASGDDETPGGGEPPGPLGHMWVWLPWMGNWTCPFPWTTSVVSWWWWWCISWWGCISWWWWCISWWWFISWWGCISWWWCSCISHWSLSWWL